MNYEDIKKLIKTAASKCSELQGARITDAYPPQSADSPVKQNICAIGLLAAEKNSKKTNVIQMDINFSISAFADIYTPVSKGGDYACACAFALCSAIGNISGTYEVKAEVQGTTFVNTCYAFKSRIVLTLNETSSYQCNDGIENSFYIFINDSPYICRTIAFRNSCVLDCVECYGESYPTDFIKTENRVTVTIQRCPSDDGKTLRNIKPPFRIDFLSDYGISLTDCAVLEYKLDESCERETLTIIGKESEE